MNDPIERSPEEPAAVADWTPAEAAEIRTMAEAGPWPDSSERWLAVVAPAMRAGEDRRRRALMKVVAATELAYDATLRWAAGHPDESGHLGEYDLGRCAAQLVIGNARGLLALGDLGPIDAETVMAHVQFALDQKRGLDERPEPVAALP